MIKLMKSILLAAGKRFWGIAAILIAVYVGTLLAGPPAPETAPGEDGEYSSMQMEEESKAKETVWTCSMHPQIQLSKPGKCPMCGMDLIPLVSSDDEEGERRLVMSPAAKKLAEIQTVAVERRFANARIRLVGNVDYDETRVKTISSYVPGRIDRLFIDYTGIAVNEGDHLAEIYSPDLLTAQEELLEAGRRMAASSSQSSEFLRASDVRALDSARVKLRLYGLDQKQIEAVEKRGTGEDHMLIRASHSGVVIRKSVKEGQYVKTGTEIYTVADLSRVWVKLEAYESDLPWLRYGQRVDFQTEAYPGEHFDGIVAFIDPILDTRTRTVKVRVNVDNADSKLKPGMFVHATIHSKVARAGKIMDPNLSGKWIGPMHPEIVRDAPGPCPVCGMPLVTSESLGFVSADDENAMPLVVPATAVLKTGRRAVVYVEVPGTKRPTYDGREIVLGPRAGDYYIVQQGLEEGERVVTNGSFNIDSALQIKAKPSMMSMEGESIDDGGDVPTFRIALAPIFESYLNTQGHLAADQLEQAQGAFKHIAHLVKGVDMTLLEGGAHEAWMDASKQLSEAGEETTGASDLEGARLAFDKASRAVIELEKRFGHSGEQIYFEIFCPMAFDGGASWLQLTNEVRNPYYGQSMLDCGNVTSEYMGRVSKGSSGPAGHDMSKMKM